MISISSILFWLTYAFLTYCAVFLLITLFLKKEIPKLKKIKEWPGVTVIIPAYNEEKCIAKTIKSVLNLDYPKDKLKVIVVNDGSKDNTLKEAKKFEKHGVLVLDQENQGKAAALNNGLTHVKTEYFACLDADSIVRKDTLKKMMRYFTSKRVSAVCPLMKVDNPKNLLQKLQWLEYVLYAYIKKIYALINIVHVTPGPFSIYRTEVVKNLGGFDKNSIVEDQEIAWRMQKHHYIIRQSMEGEVLTDAPATIKDLYKQRKRWYKGSLLTIWKYRDMLFNKEYGDFGMFQAPVLLIGSFFLPFLTIAIFIYYFLYPIYKTVYKWYFIHFQILSNLKYDLTFSQLRSNWLIYNYTKLFIILFILAVNIYWFKKAYEDSGERLKAHHIIPLIGFFIAYYILLSFMWVGAMFNIIKEKTIYKKYRYQW